MTVDRQIIDPTKNVLDLVQAESRRQDDLRGASDKFNAAMRDAETRRIDELGELRATHVKEIGDLRDKHAERIGKMVGVVVGYGVAFLTLIISAFGVALLFLK